MPTTKAYKVDWNYPNWNGPSLTPDPYPGAKYHRDDIAELIAQSPDGQVTYWKGRLFNSDFGTIENRVLLVSLDGGQPMIFNNDIVAKPCPPMCGDDGGSKPLTEISIESIPTYVD
jgi:hypothetical protein